ncbi:hypothetical protein BJV77DRAFT_1064155 [Russula vinacea]|nr:hypothetical protein BJV77DRAFT_1064155 [Russula vinacea]
MGFNDSSGPAPSSTDDVFSPRLSSPTEIDLLSPWMPSHIPHTPSLTTTPYWLSSPQNSPHRVNDHNPKSLVALILAAIGGTIVLFFLALFTRQAIAYARLPRRNMELTAAAREELMQELAGCADRRRQSCLAPPPYEHAPPYEALSPHQPV